MKHEDAQVPPADAGRLETPVRPDAWWARAENGNIRVWTSAPAESLRLAEEVGFQLEPLYSQAALSAAVAAERERCANIVRYWLTGYAPSAGTHEARCVEHILEGRPASAWREKA